MPKFVVWDENIIDRTGDRVLVSGMNIENYKKNPIVLFNHITANSNDDDVKSCVIGKSIDVYKEQGKVYAEIIFDEGNEEAAEIGRLVDGDLLNAVSMRFRCIEVDDSMPYLEGQKRATVTKSELLEISIVEIPAHPDAVRQKSYFSHTKSTIVEKKSTEMEEEIKALRKNVEDLTLLVQGLVNSKSAEEVEKIKEENSQIKKELDEIKTKSNFTLADVVGAIKNSNAHNTAEDRSAWTVFDWKNKDAEGLKKLETADPKKYFQILNKVK